MKPALTSVDLRRCSTPGCNCANTAPAIYLSSKCHPGAGLRVVFVVAANELELACPCGQLIARIAVAGELPVGTGN